MWGGFRPLVPNEVSFKVKKLLADRVELNKQLTACRSDVSKLEGKLQVRGCGGGYR